ncbi:MAG: hypothetical protein JO067_14965 [Cupriavidus sp.]|nr:hypothetical protein [Cupriavidus sp.]
MRCARAMGVAVTMRDELSDQPFPDRFEPSEFYAGKAAAAESELKRLLALTPNQVEEEALADFTRQCEARDKYLKECADSLAKYSAMLGKVNEWNPPSPDHFRFKEFMVEQLQQSIDFDCDATLYGPAERLSGPTWLEAQIGVQRRMAAHSTQQDQDERDRVEGRNQWLRQLRESLA